MEKLSPSAECLLEIFCQTNEIRTIKILNGWLADSNKKKQPKDFTTAKTKLEAVRKLCKQLNILCEL